MYYTCVLLVVLLGSSTEDQPRDLTCCFGELSRGPGPWAGAFCALDVFMRDALAATGGGHAAVRAVRPTHSEWPLFLVGL